MLIGHASIFERLKKDLDAGRFHHAQLFVGPQHVGKTHAALQLAIHMQEADENVIARKHILEGVDPDTLLFLDKGEVLPIKTVREIIERSTQSHHKPYLIVVIENIGRLKVESMNALLKTLEEPRPGVVFFLTANREEDILPTIRSRCHVTHFQTVPESELEAACDGHVYTAPLMHYAMGRPGKLHQLMHDSELFTVHQEIHQDVKQFLENPDTHAAFAMARKYEKHDQRQALLDILLHSLRGQMIRQDWPLVLNHLDPTVILDTIERSKRELSHNVNAKLLLENLLLPFAP